MANGGAAPERNLRRIFNAGDGTFENGVEREGEAEVLFLRAL